MKSVFIVSLAYFFLVEIFANMIPIVGDAIMFIGMLVIAFFYPFLSKKEQSTILAFYTVLVTTRLIIAKDILPTSNIGVDLVTALGIGIFALEIEILSPFINLTNLEFFVENRWLFFLIGMLGWAFLLFIGYANTIFFWNWILKRYNFYERVGKLLRGKVTK